MPLEPKLVDRLIQFTQWLRQQGLPVGPSQTQTLLTALAWIDLSNPHDFYAACRTVLIRSRMDEPQFRELFDVYWFDSDRRPGTRHSPLLDDEQNPRAAGARPGSHRSVQLPDEGQHSGGRYSPVELLRQRDFGEMAEDEFALVTDWLKHAPMPAWQRPGRRWVYRHGSRLDVRRSFRLSLRHGGEWLRWVRRRPKPIDRPIVMLVDVSGSMARYSRALIALACGLFRGHRQPVEAFAFSTRLTRITPALAGPPAELFHRVSTLVPDWSGGTRIGAAIDGFVRGWGQRISGRGALILLVTDGWDRGDSELLHKAIGRLRRTAWRLIWLNPVAASPGYEPRTRAASALDALADQSLPSNNLASISRALEQLSGLESTPAESPGGQAARWKRMAV